MSEVIDGEQAKARRRAEAAAKRAATRVVREAQRQMEREFLATLPAGGCPWWCDGRRDWGHGWMVSPGSLTSASRRHSRRIGVVEVSMLEGNDDNWTAPSVFVGDIHCESDAWKQAATDLRAAAELLERLASSFTTVDKNDRKGKHK